MRKIISLASILIFTMVFIVGCGGKDASTGDAKKVDINVGIIEPLTGAQAPLGTAESNAIKMAIEMINEKGGVSGKISNNFYSC